MELQENRNGYTCIRARLDTDSVVLVGFGDLHAGSNNYDEKKAKEVRRYIEEENCIWVGMGDMAENSTKRSVGAGVYEQNLCPDDQIFYLKDFLEPISHKCIGYLRGNHEERTNKDSGIDVAKVVAYMLRVPYCDWEFFGIVAGHKSAFSVYAVHSYMASKSAGLALRQTEINVESILGGVDIIMRGHTHKRAFHLGEYIDIDKYNNAVVTKPRAKVITGHYLTRQNSYAAAKPTGGDPPGTVGIELAFKDKTIKPVYL